MVARTEQLLFNVMVEALRSDAVLDEVFQAGDINGFVKEAAGSLVMKAGELIPDGHAAVVQTMGIETDNSLQVLPIIRVIIDGMSFVMDMVGKDGYLGPEDGAPEGYKDSFVYDLRDKMNQRLVNDEG